MGRTFHFCFSLPTCFAGKNSGGTKSSIGCGGWILWCRHSGLTKEKMCRKKPEWINEQQMIINSLHNSLHIKGEQKRQIVTKILKNYLSFALISRSILSHFLYCFHLFLEVLAVFPLKWLHCLCHFVHWLSMHKAGKLTRIEKGYESNTILYA